MKWLLKIVITAGALWMSTLVISGIQLHAPSTGRKIGTLLVVALIFGVVNAVVKPIVKTVGCVFYVLTLGLISLLVNGLLFLLTSWIAGQLNLPFHVTGIWPAIFGALIVGFVGWLLHLVLDRNDDDQR